MQPYLVDWKWQVGIPEKNLDLVWIADTFAGLSGDVPVEHSDKVGCTRWGRAQLVFIWHVGIQNQCKSLALWQKELKLSRQHQK